MGWLLPLGSHKVMGLFAGYSVSVSAFEIILHFFNIFFLRRLEFGGLLEFFYHWLMDRVFLSLAVRKKSSNLKQMPKNVCSLRRLGNTRQKRIRPKFMYRFSCSFVSWNCLDVTLFPLKQRKLTV